MMSRQQVQTQYDQDMQNAQQAQGGLQQIGNAVTSSAVTMIMNAAQK